MRPIVDPRQGDIEDDASSTKQRSLVSLAGTLLAEISFSKLAVAWTLLVGLPALLIGAAPLLASIWITGVSSKASALLSGLWPALLLLALAVLGWFGGRPLLRLAESSFWSLNALAVQPGYVLCREGFRHLAERLLPSEMTDDQRAFTRAASAAVSGLVICGFALWLVALAWPSSRWLGNPSDLTSPFRLLVSALFNSVVLVAGYLAVAALIWGMADATMAQPRDRKSFHPSPVTDRSWRIRRLRRQGPLRVPAGARSSRDRPARSAVRARAGCRGGPLLSTPPAAGRDRWSRCVRGRPRARRGRRPLPAAPPRTASPGRRLRRSSSTSSRARSSSRS